MYHNQIKEQLQARFAGVLTKLSPKALERLVDQLNSKATTEDDIKDIIDGLENSPIPFSAYVELLEAETDRRVRQAKDNLKKEFDFVPKKPADDQAKPPIPDGQQQQPDLAAIIQQQLSEALKPFTQQISAVNELATRTRLKEAFKAQGIAESWADDIAITEGFNLDETVGKYKKRWDETKQMVINSAIDEGQVMRGNKAAPADILKKIQEFGKKQDLKAEGYNIADI